MKLAIVGAGMIVKDFLTICSDLKEVSLEVIVGVENDVPEMKQLKEKYGIKSVSTDIDEVLTWDIIDTVYVAVPNFLHYRFSKLALEAGKHVICEKPFTLNLHELKELKAIAIEKNLVLVEAITNQYLSNYQEIKKLSKNIGEIKLIECNYSQYSSRYDAFKEGTILPAFNPKLGGGALMDINIYNIHFVVGLLGKPKKVNYVANIANDIDTSGLLVLDYETSKVVCIGAKDSTAAITSTIQGDKGSIIVDGPTNMIEQFQIQYGKEQPSTVDLKVHPHRMYEEFIYFAEMIEKLDIKSARERLAHSEAVMEVVDEALSSAGIQLG